MTNNSIKIFRTLAISAIVFTGIQSANAGIREDAVKCVATSANLTEQRLCVNTCAEQALTTPDIKDCLSVGYQVEDKELNRIYQSVVTRLNKEIKQEDEFMAGLAKQVKDRLVKSQRLWIPLRDADCSMEASGSIGGSAEGIEYLDCLGKTTKARGELLKSLFQQ